MRVAVAGGTGVAGAHAVGAARAAGHRVVVLARSAGVDVRTGIGLGGALDGVDAVIDATSPGTTEEVAATAFYTTVAGTLQRAAAAAGVGHLVVLSIVGIDGPAGGYGFYAANLRHERAAAAGEVPVTVLRATQFHEFPGQVLARTRRGPVAVVPTMRCQTVAARTVGEVLVELAGAPPGDGGPVELAGPGPARPLPELARELLARGRRRAAVLAVRLPGAAGRAMATGGLLPGEGARLEGPTWSAWLDGPDAADWR